MTEAVPKKFALQRSNLFRWEIGVALLIKIVFLIGLWFVMFRWTGKPVAQPDMTAHILQSGPRTEFYPEFSSQPH